MTVNAAISCFPAFFEPELRSAYGSETDRILAGLDAAHVRPTTLRANTLRATRAEVADQLSAEGFLYQGVSWYDDAFILNGRNGKKNCAAATNTPTATAAATPAAPATAPTTAPRSTTPDAPAHSEHATVPSANPSASLWDSALIKEGRIYVQSLSSMLPPLFMRLAPGVDVLDMCAAPGGKTTQLAALSHSETGGTSRITACEQNAVRADKLAFNLRKQGAENVPIMRQDARRLDSFFSFDRVLLDAPCSGSGTLSTHDPKLAKRFSEALVKDSCKKQAALLAKALEIVKPGGVVLYSTCSVLKRENEAIVSATLQKIAKTHRDRRYIIDALDAENLSQQGIPLLPSTIEGAITVCPSALYEGFFMCRIARMA